MTIIPDFELRDTTTFHVAASCAAFVEYTSRAELPQLRARGLLDRFMHIGEGSNLLFTERYDGVVLRSADRTLTFDGGVASASAAGDVLVFAAAGNTMARVIEKAVGRGLWGLENLAGIPGMVGGAIVQNIGAYGVEVKDVVESVEAYDIVDDRFVTFTAGECDFGYRWSAFKRPGMLQRYIITGASFRLSREPRPRLDYGHLRDVVEQMTAGSEITPDLIRQAVIATRDAKLPDPSVVGSAGSFFKNPVVSVEKYDEVVATARRLWGDDTEVPHFRVPCPVSRIPNSLPENGHRTTENEQVKIPAAWFIDRCGWKGARRGGAMVWPKQPLVIVNADGTATAADIIALKDSIIDDVYTRFGISLTPEVIII